MGPHKDKLQHTRNFVREQGKNLKNTPKGGKCKEEKLPAKFKIFLQSKKTAFHREKTHTLNCIIKN